MVYKEVRDFSELLENLTQFEEVFGPIAILLCSIEMYNKVKPYMRDKKSVNYEIIFPSGLFMAGDQKYLDEIKKRYEITHVIEPIDCWKKHYASYIPIWPYHWYY